MLEGKVALVTGGAVGIGRSIALELAKEGASVAINYRSSANEALELVKEIESLGRKAVAIQADISNFDSAKALIDETVNYFGSLNIVVNNAGITDDGLLLRMKEEQFDRVITTNLKGVFNVCRHASRPLMKAEDARIINISSISGLKGNIGQANYSAAKAGVIGFTKTLAREFASRQITANVVAPGFIQTKMTDVLSDDIKNQILNDIPLKTLGIPEDIAHIVTFLASPKGKYITGQVISVDGGLSI
ncbi:MAG TPA: 3-oxoacyl-[acyl-carrier-protein] reductase [Acholeplasma sp.]|nr:3-oxoacyl-[acyl-carrier-protein] reductase [Acholeplasma sp.]